MPAVVSWRVGRGVRGSVRLELGLHLPLMELGDEGQSFARLSGAVDAARESGFAAVSANDHFLFQTPWLDGATALAAVIDRSGAIGAGDNGRECRAARSCAPGKDARRVGCPV
jgi:hypothetical protein